MSSRAPRAPLNVEAASPRRRWLRAAAGGGLGAALAGAPWVHARAAGAPTVLHVAAYPAVDEMIRAALPAFQAAHPGTEVRITSRQFNDHHTAMTTALSTAVHLPDVMALEIGYLGRFSQGGGLLPLNDAPYGAAALADRFVPYAWDQARRRDGAIVALPLDVGPGTLLWRTDLAERAGVSEAQLTGRWEEHVAAGQRLRERTGAYLVAHARELKDILIRTGLRAGDGLYFGSDSTVLVNTPRFRRAFELAREVRRQRLDGRFAAWSNEWAEAFRRGQLATQMTGAWLAGHLNNWLAPDTRGKWRASPLPEQTNVAYGGSFLALPRRADPARRAVAWDLMRLMALDRQVQLQSFKQHDAFPALRAAQDDPFFEEPLPFLGGQRARVLWRDIAGRIGAQSVHRQDAFAAEVIDTELDKVLDRGKDIATALGDAERLLQKRATR